jgi:DNA-binding transcriptional MerR regulator
VGASVERGFGRPAGTERNDRAGVPPGELSELGSGELAGLSSGELAALSSGELAARAGVTKDALRFYERRGLLARPRRSPNGYRRYPASAVSRVRLIRVAVSVGFSIDELAAILRTRDSGGKPCREVRRLAGEKVERLRREIAHLTALRAGLEEVVAEWDIRLLEAGGKRAGLLEALADRAGTPARSMGPGRTRSIR